MTTFASPDTSVLNETYATGVSWPAVIGGAFVAASLSLILLALGAGLGLSAVSPWSGSGASASEVGAGAIVWLIAMQIIASAMGGYLAGRLRTRWATVHSDEVHFRDTAHGFLVWAVALVITVYFLASASGAMIGSAARLGSSAVVSVGAAEQGEAQRLEPTAYFTDSLLRSDRVIADNESAGVRAEVGRILVNALRRDDIPTADRTYLTQVVAVRTGLSIPEADKRVSDVLFAARQAADSARKATAHLLLWIFLALLMGAFSASFAATIGGRQRDHVLSI